MTINAPCASEAKEWVHAPAFHGNFDVRARERHRVNIFIGRENSEVKEDRGLRRTSPDSDDLQNQQVAW